MPRRRSWSSTIAARARAGSGGTAEDVLRQGDVEVPQDGGCDVDDVLRDVVETRDDERHLRVRRQQRPVRATALVMTPGEICELPSGGGGDEELAGVRARERRPCAPERVRLLEQRGIARRSEPVGAGREAQLLAVAPCDGLVAVAEQRHVDGGVAVEDTGEATSVER